MDGPLPSSAAAGIDLFYKPPYYAFWNSTSPENIRAAHSWLLELISRSGPYDGVMMFSQGCALISSLFLYHQAESPQLPLPFKAAIFICGSLPLTVIEDLGLPVSPEAWHISEASRKRLLQQASSAAILQNGRERWTTQGPGTAPVDSQIPDADTKASGLDFRLIPKKLFFRIPTVHIYGGKDPIMPSSMQLAGLCDPARRKVYDHEGGHDIPRNEAVSKSIASLFEWVILQGIGGRE